jgi:hypothetical protein
MPTDLKTDAALLAKLAEAAKRHMTKDELRLQKISFILSSVSDDSTMTRKQVAEILDEAEGVAA